MTSTFFGTDGIRGIINQDLNMLDIFKIGCSIGYALNEYNIKRKIFLGKDTRLSSDAIENALASGLCSVGYSVELLGIIPTPAVAYFANKQSITGIVISASHNSYEYNGIKIFNENGFKISSKLENLIVQKYNNIQNLKLLSHDKIGKIETNNQTQFFQEYINYLLKTINKKNFNNKIKIVFDCANGASYKTIEKICQKLKINADIKFNNPNGININNNCGSTNINILQNIVLENKYDIGIAFDGDADRCIMVDNKGRVINGDKIVAICAKSFKERRKLKKNIFVSTILSNLAINDYAEKYGMKITYSDVGDKNMLDFMTYHDYILGGEQSGHIIFRNYATTGDGQLTALQFLNILYKSNINCADLVDEISENPQINFSIKINPEIRKKIVYNNSFFNRIRKLNKKFFKYKIIIRPSGTEPVLRILIEGENINTINIIKEMILDIITKLK